MSALKSKLTPAQRRGLDVLAFGAAGHRPVFESNFTTPAGSLLAGRLSVYWQTCQWIETKGLVVKDRYGELHVTDLGNRLLDQLATGALR